MPELPEIESLAFTLKPLIQGRQIKKVRIRRHFLRKKLPARLARGVDGFYIHSLARRGKYLLIYLSKTMTDATATNHHRPFGHVRAVNL